jgi:hypothetical protein
MGHGEERLAEARSGFERGRMIRRNAWSKAHPSISADSKRPTGICSKKFFAKIMVYTFISGVNRTVQSTEINFQKVEITQRKVKLIKRKDNITILIVKFTI